MPHRPTEHPNGVLVYEVDGGFVVSQHGTWLPGVYATEDTAADAAELTDAQLATLAPIYQVDGQNRAVTLDDLATARRTSPMTTHADLIQEVRARAAAFDDAADGLAERHLAANNLREAAKQACSQGCSTTDVAEAAGVDPGELRTWL